MANRIFALAAIVSGLRIAFVITWAKVFCSRGKCQSLLAIPTTLPNIKGAAVIKPTGRRGTDPILTKDLPHRSRERIMTETTWKKPMPEGKSRTKESNTTVDNNIPSPYLPPLLIEQRVAKPYARGLIPPLSCEKSNISLRPQYLRAQSLLRPCLFPVYEYRSPLLQAENRYSSPPVLHTLQRPPSRRKQHLRPRTYTSCTCPFLRKRSMLRKWRIG